MKKLFLIFNLIFIGLCGKAQSIIEVAVSFDAAYEVKSGDPITRITDVFWKLNEISSPFGIEFRVVKTENFGNVNFPQGSNPLAVITGAWVNGENLCYERDIVYHFTGSSLSNPNVVGESLNNKFCVSNNNDYFINGSINNYAAITKYQNNFFDEVSTTGHEILSHLLGVGHEDSDYCNQNLNDQIPFLCCCGEGDIPDENSLFVVSNSLTNAINQRVSSLSAGSGCLGEETYDPEIICSEFIAQMVTEDEIDLSCTGGTKNAELFIRNDELTRTFNNNQLILRPWSQLIVSSNVLALPQLNYNSSSDEMILGLGSFTLNPSQSYKFSFTINYDNVTNSNANNDVFGYIGYKCPNFTPPLDGQNNSIFIARGVNPIDNSLVLTGTTTSTELQGLITQKEQLNAHQFNKIPIYLEGELMIDQDLSLDRKFDLKMGDNAKINVINNAKFTMMNNSITPCNESDRWDQIFVEQGSKIDFRNVLLEKGKYGIRTENSSGSNLSDLMIQQCQFNNFINKAISVRCPSKIFAYRNEFNDCDYGILIKADSEISMMKMNTFNDTHCGIYLQNQSRYIDVNLNTFNKCDIGLRMINASGLIDNNITSQNIFSFVLTGHDGSTIVNNIIGSSMRGINLSNSRGLLIANNTIGLYQDEPDIALSLTNVTSSRIEQNPNILADRIAIMANNSNLTIKENPYISVNGINQTNSGGMILTSSSGQILDNLVFASDVAYGIESNNNLGIRINNNFVTMSPSSAVTMGGAIRSMGGTSEEIEENILYAYSNADGILLQNSSGNTIKCNATDYTQIGLNILDNSAAQHLEANQLQGSTLFDLSISSQIGDQVHLGNDFIGDKVIANLPPDQIPFSEFYVNDSYPHHFPSDRTPDENWFFTFDQLDQECSGIIGPGFTFYDNENALCSYYGYFKSLASIDRKKFLINLGHILKYAKTKENFILPDCIRLDSIYNTICGLEEVIETIVSINENLDFDESSNLNGNDFEYDSYQDREYIKSNLESQYSYNASWLTLDSIRLDSLKSELISINCPDTLIEVMKDVWIAYIDNLLSSDFDDAEVINPRILEIAQLCSSEYGEAVHLARSILLDNGDYTYYDGFDQCGTIAENRSSTPLVNMPNMLISPNPSNGLVDIAWTAAQSGTITIFNINGSKIIKYQISKSYSYQINMDNPGVYIAHFINDDGHVQNEKFIIVK